MERENFICNAAARTNTASRILTRLQLKLRYVVLQDSLVSKDSLSRKTYETYFTTFNALPLVSFLLHTENDLTLLILHCPTRRP